jgi:hypothetical protein
MRFAWGTPVRATVLITIASCGGSTASNNNPDVSPVPGSDAGTHPVGADASSPVLLSDAGTGPMVNCGPNSPAPTSIAGTWDVQGSRMSDKPLSATLLIDASHFTFAVANGASLTFSSAGNANSLVWLTSPHDAPVNILTTHANAALSQGIIPPPLGGTWTFAGSAPGDPARCQAQIGAPTFTAGCVGTSGFPEPFPYSLDGTITATRTQTLPSVFGDLGGTWHLTDQATGTCDASFRGNTLSVVCADANVFTGEASLTFCDGVAAGSTSAGIEFSALRQ